jgi:hypothetical protein
MKYNAACATHKADVFYSAANRHHMLDARTAPPAMENTGPTAGNRPRKSRSYSFL